VSPFQLSNQRIDYYEICYKYLELEATPNLVMLIFLVRNSNMANVRTCELGATLATLNVGPNLVYENTSKILHFYESSFVEESQTTWRHAKNLVRFSFTAIANENLQLGMLNFE